MEFRGHATYQTARPLNQCREWMAYEAISDASEVVELRVLQAFTPTAEFARRLQRLSFCQSPGLRRLVEVQTDTEPPFLVVERSLGDVNSQDGPASNLPVSSSPRTMLKNDQIVSLFDGLSTLHRYGLTLGLISPQLIQVRTDGSLCLDAMLSWSQAESGSDDSELDVAQLASVLIELLQPQRTLNDPVLVVLRKAREHGADRSSTSAASAAGASSMLTAIFVANQIRVLLNVLAAPNVSQPTPGGEVEKTFVAQAAVAPSSRSVPDQLGRFQLYEPLGEGAVGAVYRAVDTTDGSEVAIKILNERLAQNAVTLRRFTKEARMLSRAESPYVARLIESNVDQGLHYLALEFVAGGTLTSLIRSGTTISETAAIKVVLDVAMGLSMAHRDSVFHRDIKPDNILLTRAGAAFLQQAGSVNDQSVNDQIVQLSEPVAKLSDFGLARAADQSESLDITHDGAILGTPLYMSPEQCRGLAADARSDVYSLGATLFHLLAGRPPFPGDTHVAVMNAHCHDPLPSLKQLRPSLSDACITVVEKCLARNPDARYFDADALLSDLQRLLHGEPTSILVHPAAPKSEGLDVVEYQFTCDLKSSPERLWPYVSNTDRINHSIGLASVTYTTRTHPERGVERFAEARIAGQKLAWQEHPYEWVEGRRLSVLREFSSGPFAWFMNIVELQPASGGGTRIVQTLRATPKNFVGKMVAKLEMARKAPRNFTRVYSQIDNYLQQGAAVADPFVSKTAISSIGRRRLQERSQVVGSQAGIDPAVMETLRQFLENASDLEIARIRPLVFAERFQLPANDVVKACLLGAKEGLLVHLWDILCPSCRIPADVQETLASLKDHAYCPACDLKYDLDFASSVELIFRAHPDIRSAETRVYCIGGPAFSAHVVAQIRLAPGEQFDLELALSEGVYRLRGPQLPFAVDLTVSAGRGATRLPLSLLRPPTPGTIPILRQGSQVISFDNNTSRDLQLRLERTAGRQQALTASAAATMPLFRELFPNEVLSPGQMVSIASITLLMVDLTNAEDLYASLGDGPAFGMIRKQLLRIDEIVRSHGGSVVRLIGEGAFCVFQTTTAALRAALELLQQDSTSPLKIRAAMDHGPAMVTTLNDRLDYFGAIVARARKLLELGNHAELIIPARLSFDPEIAQLLRDAGAREQLESLTVNTTTFPIKRIRLPK